MFPSDAFYSAGWSAVGLTLLARVRGWSAAAIVQADIASIQCTVRDLSVDDEFTYDAALTVSAVVFNTLQTDSVWDVDTTGYNFRATIPASAFPTPDADPAERVYRVSVRFTPVSGEPFVAVWDHTARRST